MGGCTHICGETRGQPQRSFLGSHASCFVRWGLSLGPGARCGAIWLASTRDLPKTWITILCHHRELLLLGIELRSPRLPSKLFPQLSYSLALTIRKLQGAGEMAQQLKAHTALSEDQSFVLHTHVGQLKIVCNYRFWRSDTIFWPLWEPYSYAQH